MRTLMKIVLSFVVLFLSITIGGVIVETGGPRWPGAILLFGGIAGIRAIWKYGKEEDSFDIDK